MLRNRVIIGGVVPNSPFLSTPPEAAEAIQGVMLQGRRKHISIGQANYIVEALYINAGLENGLEWWNGLWNGLWN